MTRYILLLLSLILTSCASESPAKYVALSFDDGPNETTTVQMLDILEEFDVPASFFVIGQNINELHSTTDDKGHGARM